MPMSKSAACAALILGLAAGSLSPAGAQENELQKWAGYYWYLAETGSPHPDAKSFKFSNEALNQPGTFPLAASVAAFRDLYADSLRLEASGCQYTDVTDLIGKDATLYDQFKKYTLSGVLATTEAKASGLHLTALTKGLLENGDEFANQGSFAGSGPAVTSDGLSFTGQGKATAGWPDAKPTDAVQALGDELAKLAQSLAAKGVTGLVRPLDLIQGKVSDDGETDALLDRLARSHPGLQSVPVIALLEGRTLVRLYQVRYGEAFYVVDLGAAKVLGPYLEKSALPGTDVAALHQAGPAAAVTFLAVKNAACAALAPAIPSVPSTPGTLPPAPPGTPPWAPLPPWGPTRPAWNGVVVGGYTCYTTPIGGGGVNCLCSRQLDYRRNLGTRCFLWLWPCWTVWQYARETETCSWSGSPPLACVPPPPSGCSTSHEIF
jgi:hypothetical protein